MPIRLYTALCLGAAVVAVSCSTPARAAHPEPVPARAVSVDRASKHDLDRTLEIAAEFRPYQEIDLHAKVAGYLRAIFVDVGDHVAKGQPIAELEAPEMTQELAQADATLRRSQVDVERAHADLRRSEAQENLRRVGFERLSGVVKVRRNLVAQQDVDDAQARLQESEAQLAASRAAVGAAEEQVQIAMAGRERLETLQTYLKISAPFAGTITRRLADPGAMIQAGTASHVQAMPVVQLSEVDRLRLILPVPESAVPQIRLGSPVEVRVDALSRVFQGHISRFSGKLDAATRTMETEVDLPNADLTIKAGMFGVATLLLEQHRDALAVPVQALASRSAPFTVLAVGDDHRLQERRIEVGLQTPEQIEVVSGLKEGDLVVVGARGDLRPGLLVTPKPQTHAVGER